MGIETAAGMAEAGKKLSAASIAVSILGTFYQVRGIQTQAKSRGAVYAYNAQLLERNAKIQEQNARKRIEEAALVRRAGLEEQRVSRKEMRRTLKTHRTLYAKAGVLMEGSPMDFELQVVEDVSEDIGRLAKAYELEAKGITSQAAAFRTLAETKRLRGGYETFKAKAAKRAGRLGVGTALVGSISDISRLGISRYLSRT